MKELNGEKLVSKLDELELERMGEGRPAGLWISSLPWPRTAPRPVSLKNSPTYVRPLGQWPGQGDGTPRRLLMVADGGDERAPDSLRIERGSFATPAAPPAATAELFARSEDPYFMWERHRLRISHQGRSLGLAMGMRANGEVRWWEACRLVELEETPSCRVVEIGGAIPLHHSHMDYEGDYNKWLHEHHWLYGHVRARLHANGVCEVYAHHINSKYVDDGKDLAHAVPVIGLHTEDMGAADELCGEWDGSCEDFKLGGATFDVEEAARLATPQKPGRMDRQDDMLVWQPYLGCELFGGQHTRRRKDNGFVLKAEEQKILRGMGRTLRFSVSLSDRPPRVVRYLPPAWWYGLCEEFVPKPYLPVMSKPEKPLQTCREWLTRSSVKRGFEDGGMARAGRTDPPYPNDEVTEDEDRIEPGWEGEIPYAQFLNAWRYGDAEEYDLAMRSAYHFSDVAVDHAANLVRMHGYPPTAFALPMNRIQGPLAAFLETGDDYLRDTAERVIEGAWRQHRNAWPRLAVGRDGCFIRGAVLLYRYFANDHFRKIAREASLNLAQSQRPNGSFGDQGGGTGVHQFSSYVTKPWMGLLGTAGVVDYLELFPDNPELVRCVRRFADWLMDERRDRDGVLSWCYQHDYNGMRKYRGANGDVVNLMEGHHRWHHETLAHLLGYCALRFNNAAYLDAWAESHLGKKKINGDHPVSAALQFLPWIQAQLFQTTIDRDGGWKVTGVHFGPRTFESARVLAPEGDINIEWTDDGRLNAPSGVRTLIHDLEFPGVEGK